MQTCLSDNYELLYCAVFLYTTLPNFTQFGKKENQFKMLNRDSIQIILLYTTAQTLHTKKTFYEQERRATYSQDIIWHHCNQHMAAHGKGTQLTPFTTGVPRPSST